MTEPNLDELAEALAEFDVPQREGGRSAREERIVAGFEEIQRFVEQHGRRPLHGDERDIFETAFSTSIRVIYENPADRATLEYLMILKVFEFSREWNLPLQPLDNIADAFVRKEHFEGIEEL